MNKNISNTKQYQYIFLTKTDKLSDLSNHNVQAVFNGRPLFSTDEICSKNFRVNFGELKASVRIVFEGEEDKGMGEISEKSREPGGIAIFGTRTTNTKRR